MVYHGLYSYRQRVRVITLFPNIFFDCFCMLSESEKVFERKVWRAQKAHLPNAARAVSSRSRCFQLWTNVDKDFFRCLWYCGKKQIECGLAWSVLLSTAILVITVVKICCETVFSSDTSTKHETAIFKICSPAIITAPEVIVAEYDAILGQWEREDFYNHLSNYANDRYSSDVSAETGSTYWPTSTDKHVGRYSADTSPPLGRHSADTLPALGKHYTHLVSSCLAFNSGNIHVFFPAMFFPRHRLYIRPSLLSEVAAFGACCFRRFVILGEQKLI